MWVAKNGVSGMKILGLGIIGATLLGAVMFSGAASAAPLMATGANAGSIQPDNMIVQVQRRAGARNFGGGGARNFGGGGGRNFARGGRGFGGRGAAIGLGLGVLGAAVAIGAAQSCWRRQAVLGYYGEVVGYRRVYVC